MDLFQRIIVEEDQFSLEELECMSFIDDNPIVRILPGYHLVVSDEFLFQVLFNPDTKHIVVMKYGEVETEGGYENDYSFYYSYNARKE